MGCDTGVSERDIEVNRGKNGESAADTGIVEDTAEIVPLPKLGTIAAMLLSLGAASAIMFPLVYFSRQYGVIQDRMVAIVLIVESGAPSAQTMIVAMNSLGSGGP